MILGVGEEVREQTRGKGQMAPPPRVILWQVTSRSSPTLPLAKSTLGANDLACRDHNRVPHESGNGACRPFVTADRPTIFGFRLVAQVVKFLLCRLPC